MKIISIESLSISTLKIEQISNYFQDRGHEFIYYNDKPVNDKILIERAQDAEILIASNAYIDAPFIEACPKLKLIAVAYTGYDHVDLTACKRNGISVCNVPAYSIHAVAELVIGLCISLLRKFQSMDHQIRTGKERNGFLGNELYGKTIGIIGTGNIGLATAHIFKAFGCNIIAYSRTEKKEAIDAGFRYVSLTTLLSQSDVISLHAPLNETTKGMIDTEEIALMKPQAILINTARGLIVNYRALADALNNGKIGGVGIDVYENEPPISGNHPLLNCPNSILLPHIGFATEEAIEKRADIAVRNITKWIEGSPENIVG